MLNLGIFLHAVKLRHGTDGFTSPPKEGVLRIFFATKIWRLRPGANPRTWVPKASTLPLDHRRCFLAALSLLKYFITVRFNNIGVDSLRIALAPKHLEAN